MNGPSCEAHVFEGDYYMDVGGIYRLVTQNAPITMMATDSVNGGFTVTAATSVNLICGMACLNMAPSGETGGQIALTAGPTGSVVASCGPPLLAAGLSLTPEEISLAIGPPGLGASIKMTPESITLQVAATKFTMTPFGITETLLELINRSLSILGHNLTAAETEVAVSLVGVSTDAPVVLTEAEAVLAEEDAVSLHESAALNGIAAGLLFIE